LSRLKEAWNVFPSYPAGCLERVHCKNFLGIMNSKKTFGLSDLEKSTPSNQTALFSHQALKLANAFGLRVILGK
jgi:hypothetical protein